jgi:hypothetical protein
MPIDIATPRFPLHETLTRFFRLDPRQRVPLSELAELLGTTDERTRDPGYLFDAWPRGRGGNDER